MGRYLEQTIESVLAQDYPNIEYIVMDGGSSDDSLRILEKYRGRLEFHSGRDREGNCGNLPRARRSPR